MSPRPKESNNLRTSLLGFFIDKPYHGYELYQHIKKKTEFQKIWNIKQSLFYSYLDNFFIDGCLSKQIYEGNQFPDRKVYAITELGEKVFKAWITDPVLHGREMRQEFLAKLYFTIHNDSNSGLMLIDLQRKECQKWVASIKLEQEKNSSIYQELILQYRIMQIDAMIEWLGYVELNLIKTVPYN